MNFRYQTKEMNRIWKEENRFRYFLKVEKAVAETQAELGIIPREAYQYIKKANYKLKEIEELEKITGHDVLAFVQSLEKSIPKYSEYIHFGLTSYDIVDTALALRCQSACEVIITALSDLRKTIKDLALKYKQTPMIGRTHGMHAEPITFGLKCLSWYTEIGRAEKRMEAVKEENSFGKISGVVGSFSQLPPSVEERTLKKLGLKPEPVSTQVLPRDRLAHLISVIAIISASLERIATEIRNLQRSEIGEVQEPFFAGQKGSSAMPHKKNPILCERVCALSRIIRSQIVPALENIPLWHERDLTNSAAERIILPLVFNLLHYSINTLNRILKNLLVFPEKMKANLKLAKGQFFSQSLLLALIKKGIKRSKAYDIVQRLSFQTQETGAELKTLAKQDEEVKSCLKESEIKEIFSLKRLLRNIDLIFDRVLKREGKND
jgi:adenylosuccinate lyase